ncbi:MAG: molybdopterin molybdotransferase MoeA [Paracoccaceae bacterium]|nr:molybdopterin molybdotransferase MoeA [Paracoccaceae bacterium]
MEVDLGHSSEKNHHLTSYSEALELLFGLQKFVTLNDDTITLENSRGRVLSGEVKALIDNPPADVSSMDGYAVNSSDERLNGILRVIDVSAAGNPARAQVSAGSAVRIFTGAKLPEGANSVIIQEEVTSIKKSEISINNPEKILPNENVRKKGTDFIEGTSIKPGKIITPKEIMLFAAMGHDKLLVKQKPLISIISIGDELTKPGNPHKKNQIFSSNAYGIASLLNKLSCNPVIFPIARDNMESIKRNLDKASQNSDIIVTTGGASVGAYDLVKSAAKELGLHLCFEKVNIRPGKPTFAGYLRNVPLIGLPGNPVSSYVCAQLFLLPLVMKIIGCKVDYPIISSAKLKSKMNSNGFRKHFVRANMRNDGGIRIVSPKNRQDSSLIKTLQESNCLIIRPSNDNIKDVDDLVDIIELI